MNRSQIAALEMSVSMSNASKYMRSALSAAAVLEQDQDWTGISSST